MDLSLVISQMIADGDLPSGLTILNKRNIYSELEITGATKPTEQAMLDVWAIIESDVIEEQESEQARQELRDGATTSKKSWKLIQMFNDPPEADVKAFLQGGGTPATLDRNVPLNQTYTAWRAIFDSLPDKTKVRIMWHGYMLSHTFEFVPEPATPSQEYKAWFNHACANLLGYVTDRAQG